MLFRSRRYSDVEIVRASLVRVAVTQERQLSPLVCAGRRLAEASDLTGYRSALGIPQNKPIVARIRGQWKTDCHRLSIAGYPRVFCYSKTDNVHEAPNDNRFPSI